jgi:hypothetical protein
MNEETTKNENKTDTHHAAGNEIKCPKCGIPFTKATSYRELLLCNSTGLCISCYMKMP